jgi:very-short-patch-repair endonuclease
MNPNIYSATDINPTTLKSAQEIWNRDANKQKQCESKGIKLITIWESEWLKNSDQIKNKILKNLKESINTCNVVRR